MSGWQWKQRCSYMFIFNSWDILEIIPFASVYVVYVSPCLGWSLWSMSLDRCLSSLSQLPNQANSNSCKENDKILNHYWEIILVNMLIMVIMVNIMVIMTRFLRFCFSNKRGWHDCYKSRWCVSPSLRVTYIFSTCRVRVSKTRFYQRCIPSSSSSFSSSSSSSTALPTEIWRSWLRSGGAHVSQREYQK